MRFSQFGRTDTTADCSPSIICAMSQMLLKTSALLCQQPLELAIRINPQGGIRWHKFFYRERIPNKGTRCIQRWKLLQRDSLNQNIAEGCRFDRTGQNRDLQSIRRKLVQQLIFAAA